MLQVQRKHTLGTHTPNPAICLPHIQALGVSTQRGVYVLGSDLGIVPAATQLLVRSGESARMCVHSVSSHVCGYRICVFPHVHLHHVAPGRALSRPQESLWERVGKASGNVCAKLSDGFVSITAAFGPGAVTEDQNRELVQRSSSHTGQT